MTKKEKKKQREVLGLIILLVVVLIGSIVFVGAVGGWFDDEKVVLNNEYVGDFIDFKNITTKEYEGLIGKKDSFVLLVDQSGCNSADKLREFMKNFATEKKIKVLRIMFSDMKETSLHDYVKYYPSVVMISKGKPVVYLRADSDEDAEKYNNYEVFKTWIEKYI